MNFSIAISRKIALAYSAVCKPLCRQLELPQTAFDILMFLGNNPDYKPPVRLSRSGTSRRISFPSMSIGSCGKGI